MSLRCCLFFLLFLFDLKGFSSWWIFALPVLASLIGITWLLPVCPVLWLADSPVCCPAARCHVFLVSHCWFVVVISVFLLLLVNAHRCLVVFWGYHDKSKRKESHSKRRMLELCYMWKIQVSLLRQNSNLCSKYYILSRFESLSFILVSSRAAMHNN